MTEIHATKKLTRCGNSIVINVTLEAEALGLTRGDWVGVTIAPVEKPED